MTNAVALLVVLSAFGGGCGGGGTTGGDASTAPSGSGVDGNKRIVDMTDADVVKICEFTAALYGGYGKTIRCEYDGGASMSAIAPKDLAECKDRSANMPAGCTGTVAQMEACLRAIPSCDRQDDPIACAPVAACFSMGGP